MPVMTAEAKSYPAERPDAYTHLIFKQDSANASWRPSRNYTIWVKFLEEQQEDEQI